MNNRRELYQSEIGTIVKGDERAKYNACCISCGATDRIELWPHRNGHGDMVGFIFACRGCAGVVKGITLHIQGIRGDYPKEADHAG
jgi:hypothetical protein